MSEKRKRRKRESITVWLRPDEAATTGDLRRIWDSIKTEVSKKSGYWRMTGLRRRDA